jgi:hypothetical protein
LILESNGELNVGSAWKRQNEEKKPETEDQDPAFLSPSGTKFPLTIERRKKFANRESLPPAEKADKGLAPAPAPKPLSRTKTLKN